MIATLTALKHLSGGVELVNTLTGIPIEALFAMIGALGSLVYLDIKREVRWLRKESAHRTRVLDSLCAVFHIAAKKLDIPWSPPQDSD